MHDALFELPVTELSCILQDRQTTLDKADRATRRTIYRLQLLKDKPGTKTIHANLSIKNLRHGSVPLHINERWVQFNYKPFYTSLFDNKNARLFSSEQDGNLRFLDELKVLESSNWLESPQVDYGKKELSSLAKESVWIRTK